MRTNLFLEHFHTLVKTPEDVAGLEVAILDLAVRGQLMSQDPNDEPASLLLGRIRIKKRQLVEERRIPKSRKLPSISPDESPLKLPPGWAWARLGNITEKLGSGSTPRGGRSVYQDQGIKFIRSQNVWNDGLRLDGVAFISEKINERMSATIVQPKDILLNITGASIGRSALVPDDFDAGNVSQHVSIVRLVDPSMRGFIHLCLISPIVQSMIWGVQVGISRPGLSKKRLEEFVIPIPPLGEQKRIVARVDELLAQTRTLAAQLEAADEALVPAAQASFQALTEATDEATQGEAWQRIRDAFDALSADPRTLDALKQTVLQLAVQGKLVPQDPEDEPASVLLERIRAEKERLTQAGKIKRPKRLPRVNKEQIPYELPRRWCWARFGHVANIATNLTKPGLHPDLPHIAPNNIEKGSGKLLPYNTVQEDGIRSSNHHFYPGQLLYSKIRPNLSKVVLVDFEGLCSADMYPIDAFVDPHYLFTYILSKVFLDMVVGKDTRVAMPKINQTELNKLLVAVPPLAEQKRIVAKVESLLALCDALAAEVVAAEEVRGRLLGAVLNGE